MIDAGRIGTPDDLPELQLHDENIEMHMIILVGSGTWQYGDLRDRN